MNFDRGFAAIPNGHPGVHGEGYWVDRSGRPYSRANYQGQNQCCVQIPGYGNVIEFDGINDKLTYAYKNNGHLEIKTNDIFSFFVRWRAMGWPIVTWVTVIEKRSFIFPGSGIAILLWDNGTTQLIWYNSGENFSATLSTGYDTDWHTLVLGFDGSVWWREYDGVYAERVDSTHNGFGAAAPWTLGSSNFITRPSHCQIAEWGLVKDEPWEGST